MANEIKEKPKFSAVITSESYVKLINDTLGDPNVARQFIADISAVVANNPLLQECDPKTIVTAGLVATSLKLPLAGNLGLAYIVPYKDRKTGVMRAQFQVGWKGFVQLSQRSSQFERLGSRVVHKGEYQGQDEFGDDLFKFSHDYDNEEVVGYYAYFRLLNGFTKTLYMTKEQCEKHASKYSMSYKNDKTKTTLWNTEFDTMAQKTVLKLLLNRYAPLSVELQKAIKADQAIVHDDGTFEYVDNEKLVSRNKMTINNTIEEIDEVKEVEEADPSYELFE